MSAKRKLAASTSLRSTPIDFAKPGACCWTNSVSLRAAARSSASCAAPELVDPPSQSPGSCFCPQSAPVAAA